MKILFLDIDGPLVINDNPTETRYGRMNMFDERCVAALNDIWRHTGCEIVVSSDWILNNFDSKLQMARNVFQYNNVTAPVIGFTRKLSTTPQEVAKLRKSPVHPRLKKIKDWKNCGDLELCRTLEILEWVDTHNPEAWVAVDDLWLGQLGLNFVVIDPIVGLNDSAAKEHIIRQLNS
jgi:hypothetical protein